ncbi:MAG: hypothetical protein QM493_07735 [Sulfurovum sp.]
MIDIVLTLTFSIVMLFFLVFPAMKSVEFIETHIDVPNKWHTPLLLFIIIFFSLLIGLFLRFA